MEGRKYLITFVALFFIKDVWSRIRVEGSLEDSKIVGGYATRIDKFPFQVLMFFEKGNRTFLCGGSILSPDYILTAGHCVNGIDKAYVLAGVTYRNNSEDQPLLPVESFQYHPRFNRTNFDYDIGLLKLKTKLVLDGKKKKATCLVKSGTEIPVDTPVTVSGWGTTAENGTLSNVLRAVNISIIPHRTCELDYSRTNITSRMICAGASNGGKDSCQGDSGGPIIITSTREQFGTVSFGKGCARQDKPGVYADLSNPELRSWIYNITGV